MRQKNHLVYILGIEPEIVQPTAYSSGRLRSRSSKKNVRDFFKGNTSVYTRRIVRKFQNITYLGLFQHLARYHTKVMPFASKHMRPEKLPQVRQFLLHFTTLPHRNIDALFKSTDECLFYLLLAGGQTYIYHSLQTERHRHLDALCFRSDLLHHKTMTYFIQPCTRLPFTVH